MTWRATRALMLEAFALSALCVVTPESVSPQGLTAAWGMGSSSSAELPSPQSVRVDLAFPAFSRFAIGTGGRFAWDSQVRPGVICDVGWPDYEGCLDEGVRAKLSVLSMWLSVVYGVPLRAAALRLGVRGSLHVLGGDYMGAETRRGANVFMPDAPDVGLGLDASLSIPIPRAPVSLVLGVSRESLGFGGCATDVAAPFCESEFRFSEVIFGLEIQLPEYGESSSN